jgi:hypothetical protein
MRVGTEQGPHNLSKPVYEDAESHYILLHQVPRQIWQLNFLKYEEKSILWLLPRNSYEKHMTRPELHMFIHIWWTQMKNMMNPDEDHHERNNILKFIRDQNVCPEFQVKACGTQDTWHNTIGHPTTAIWAQGLYKYSSKAQHYLHHCKAYKKTTLILFEALANWNWSISKAFIT